MPKATVLISSRSDWKLLSCEDVAIGRNMRSVSWAGSEDTPCVLLIGMMVLVCVSYMGEIGVDDKDCSHDQDWTCGEIVEPCIY